MNNIDYKIESDLSAASLLPHYNLIKLLNPNLKEETFIQSVQEMNQNPNYKVILIYNGKECIAICGYWIATKLYCGKYLEMDNVIVKPAYQRKGIGNILSELCENIATENNCNVMMLDAYIENELAHKFYENHGFIKKGYHFVKKLVKTH
jgi:ribosomal protein S18 acetylase RimI-like enzyme